MKLIVGLGNPGKEYDCTRHNVGFMVLDNYILDDYKNKFNGNYLVKNINGEKVLFLKPMTYMNNSGDCVYRFVNYFDIDVKDILVIQDDMDLAIGDFKLKKNSSDGGHNGIKSIISNLNTKEFLRLKIGIGHNGDTINHVLGKFSKAECEALKRNFSLYGDIITDFIKYDSEVLISNYNSRR